ncbi:MAG: nickel pincer cofactor biosynthesis protein LarB [Candidatus Omnitrophota bacterium]
MKKHLGGFCDLGFAKIDTDRINRRGFPEVVFAQGKTLTQLKEIARTFIVSNHPLILTRINQEQYKFLKKIYPKLKLNPLGKIAYLTKNNIKKIGNVLIITAGTSDIPIAEEAAVTLEIMGNNVTRLYDVGVAGVHRVLDKKELLRKANCIIVVAGMEGALASLVSGLVSSPVIGVPTSCGYGANFGGLSSLLTMLNSCSPGVVVVNIDNGFGAGYFASLVNKGQKG